MKKIYNLFLVFIFLCACSNGTKVSLERFQNAVNNLEKWEYSSAIVDITVVGTGTGIFESNQDFNEKAKLYYHYDKKTYKWVKDNEQHHSWPIASTPPYSLYGKFIDSASENSKYYLNPFRIVTEIKYSEAEGKAQGTVKEEIKFDKYGFITNYKWNINYLYSNDEYYGDFVRTETAIYTYKI